ncbi:MAG: sugar kinase [Alphaproteobacteria bacterium]|nr:MAG: sugar kinase [Alphaproteobacteria bacterium]
MNRAGHIVCFGELLVRFSPPGREILLQSPRLEAHFGGAEANVAVSLARFGHDVRSVSTIPANALGSGAVEALRRYGVDVRHVATGVGRMGQYFLSHGAVLRRSEVIYDRANSAFALAEPDSRDWDAIFDGASLLHVSGVTPAIGPRAAESCLKAVQAAVRAGVAVSFDGNYRELLWSQWNGDKVAILREILGHATYAFINEKDVALILGQNFADPDVMDRRQKACALAFETFPKLSHISATFRTQHGVEYHELSAAMFTREAVWHARTYPLDGIVDRIGTGDAFAAGVLHGLVSGKGEQYAIDFGTAAATLKHSIPGDFNLVTLQQVEQLLADSGLDVSR